MEINPYPPVYMDDPVRLFLCREYGYRVLIPGGGYLSIVISTWSRCMSSLQHLSACFHVDCCTHWLSELGPFYVT
jgi:hypothetical protein